MVLVALLATGIEAEATLLSLLLVLVVSLASFSSLRGAASSLPRPWGGRGGERREGGVGGGGLARGG